MEKNDDFILDVKNKLGDYVEKQQLKSLEQLIIDTYQNPEKILSNFSSLIDKNSLCFVFLNAYSETINEFVEHCSTQKTKVPEIGIALLKIITEFCFIEE
jgi:tRNA A58 N-methylase Trm61